MEGRYLLDPESSVWIKKSYENQIEYSDGTDVETKIHELLKQCSDVSVLSEELESHIFNWTSLCFFSKKRANLLRPFASLFKGKTIPEVGCGAGSITRFLGECGANVHAIEPSLRRARIAAERCRDLPNVTIYSDDIAHFESDITFDGIIQVGVLEYATKYSKESDATLKFLVNLQQYLANDGFLITAIENQLGLKYFSGFHEDHNGVLMHSINNNYKPGEATTLGRKRLLKVFEAAGFTQNDMFLPFPDYKMPSLVFYPGFNEKNEQCKVSIESILSNISYQDPQQSMPLFSLDKALPLIAQNDLLYDLSNSFCIFSQKKRVHKPDEDILFAFYRTDLKKEYCKQTMFRQDGNTVKVVRNYLEGSQTGKDKAISFDQEELAYSGILHHYELVDLINREQWTIEQMGAWLTTWFNCLKKELCNQYGFTEADLACSDLKIKSRYTDALPINLLMQETGYRFIDLEINLQKDVELGYIVFRAVHVSLSRLSSIAMPRDIQFIEAENILYALFAHLGLPLNESLLDRYYECEANLANNVAPVHLKTVRGAVSRLRVRPVINEISQSYNNMQSLQIKLASLEGQLKSMEGQVVSLEGQVVTLEGQVVTLEGQLETKEGELETMEDQVELLEGELEYKKADINHLNVQVHEKQNHITGLYHEIHSLSTSRKRMVKQFIKRTIKALPFLGSFF
jgi:2-polyprenyl-3-methyl-5-hydroxy-6-metoxy-1,4-benzoquinol methylase